MLMFSSSCCTVLRLLVSSSVAPCVSLLPFRHAVRHIVFAGTFTYWYRHSILDIQLYSILSEGDTA